MENPKTKRPQAFARTATEGNSEQEIRRRAYELYEARGRGDGHDLEDWVEAEAEITRRAQKDVA